RLGEFSDRGADIQPTRVELRGCEHDIRDHESARILAASRPDARLVVLEGVAVGLYAGDVGSVHEAIDEFLGDAKAAAAQVQVSTEEARAGSESATVSGTAVILFADIVDSTALTERLGDAAFRAQARHLDAALRSIIREHAGTPIEGKF